MLLMSDIGFWHEVCAQYLPNCRFLLQNERSDFSTLVNTSSLPSFTSNLTLGDPAFSPGRVYIPITDDEAKTDYYAVCLKSEHGKLKDFFKSLEKESEL